MTKSEAARSDEVRLLASDVDRLIKRLESDAGGSRVLDHAIIRWMYGMGAAATKWYTTNIKEAIELVPTRYAGRTMNIYGVFQPKVTVTIEVHGAHIAASARTESLAVCAAVIRLRKWAIERGDIRS